MSGEWARFQGMLAIPYWTVSGPVGVKFRRLFEIEGAPKYDQPAGQEVRLFNALACQSPGEQIIVTEGEIDAITLSAEVGIPAVGVAGVNNWKRHYRRCLDGFNDIVVLTDNDAQSSGRNPGADLAYKIKEQVPSSRIVNLPPGEDVNSYFLKVGRGGIIDLIA